jgi:hypothetical protein
MVEAGESKYSRVLKTRKLSYGFFDTPKTQKTAKLPQTGTYLEPEIFHLPDETQGWLIMQLFW